MSISVENFYWVLYENLLKPAGLDCRYHWPFDSGNVMKWPFESQQGLFDCHANQRQDEPRNARQAFFHFDQEPIYAEDEYTICKSTSANYHRNIRILANSERSMIKKDFCRRLQMIDWYYFYHGFAALDWYRDAEHVTHDQGITDAFSSFNHIIRNKRAYRMALTARLSARGILDRGTVSFHGDAQDCSLEITDPYTQLSPHSQQLVDQYLIQPNHQPLLVDSQCVDGNYSALFGGNTYRMRQRSFLHLVNETIFYDQKLHLTEKIFHPIVHMRPFVLVAAPGNLEYLRSYGFETFSGWIDEYYDEISDHDLRLDHIARETERIARMPIHDLRHMLDEMRPVLEHNKQHFFSGFKKIIADELVDNFEICLRIWNNGRVDDHSVTIPSCDQLKLAKQLLSR